MTYYIEYKVNGENKAIHHASVEGENRYDYCMENILDVKLTGTVYMRAAFGDIKGLWSNLRMSYETRKYIVRLFPDIKEVILGFKIYESSCFINITA